MSPLRICLIIVFVWCLPLSVVADDDPGPQRTGTTGTLTVDKPQGTSENPLHIHDENVARYTLYLFWATFAVAAIALFQEPVRTWAFRPRFKLITSAAPPTCVAMPMMSKITGEHIANAVHLGVWIQNDGRSIARQVEVFASELSRKRADGGWDVVNTFPPMNLLWANIERVYIDIAPGSKKRLDVGHIADPDKRARLAEDASNLQAGRTALVFALMVQPNNKGHIVGPGEYQVKLEVAAHNAKASRHTLTITVPGPWYADEAQMLRDGVGISVK